ncbi:FHA domain-containing protein [Limnoglobus roseus]|uniref:LuxR family transcriptional regulator n=1 Tax=Limnoglobus roseus TaxID=2598579 RepID=A0A5C1AQH1_9BACT|nr:FHA domain-containing protein [Limnoglobus roseus]QEL20276.1 LuxR family transcriptional regulator [Limnoglobus roseus]
MPAIARLTVTSGGGGVLVLRAGRYRIGRSRECDLFLDDPTVSRVHAVVVVTDESVSVVDNASLNGTFVDGERVATCVLTPDAVILFGGVECTYEPLERPPVEESTHCAKPGPRVHGTMISPAEERVFNLLLCGHSEKMVAAVLSLSRNTVHNHVKQIYRAFGVHSRSELLAKVLRSQPHKQKQR